MTARLGDAMFGRYRLDAALGLVETASAEFLELGDDPGLATLLGQLARFQMLRQVDFGAAVANADRTLVIAERLDRVDLVADTLVTRGVALVSVGRAYEGIGCLETGLRLAQQHGLLRTEIRARINMGGPLLDRDPRAAFEVSRVGLEQVRRFGHRQGVSMLIGNASIAAIETGEWEWARSEIDLGLEEASSEEERIVLLDFFIQLRVQGGGSADTELDEAGAWLGRQVAHEPYLESTLAWNRASRALQDGDFAASAAAYLESGRRDPFGAVGAFGEAAFMALLAFEPALVETVGGALRAIESHAPMGRVSLRLVDAGIAAHEGNSEAARTGLLGAYADFRDLGAVRKQALTGLVMATLLGRGDPRFRAAIDESRQLFERMGAGLWLARLDAALAAEPGAAARSERPASVGDAIPR